MLRFQGGAARRRTAGALAAIIASAAPASASDQSLGTVWGILVHDAGKVFFYQRGTRTARPSCATQDRWVFDVTTTTGQAMLATLLTVYAADRPVTVNGTGVCTDWGDTETVQAIQAWD